MAVAIPRNDLVSHCGRVWEIPCTLTLHIKFYSTFYANIFFLIIRRPSIQQ